MGSVTASVDRPRDWKPTGRVFFPFQPESHIKSSGLVGPLPPTPTAQACGVSEEQHGAGRGGPSKLTPSPGRDWPLPPGTRKSEGHWRGLTNTGLARGTRSKPDKPVGQAESRASGSECGGKPAPRGISATSASVSRPSAEVVSPGTDFWPQNSDPRLSSHPLAVPHSPLARRFWKGADCRELAHYRAGCGGGIPDWPEQPWSP